MKDPIIYQANNWEFVSECDAEGKSWIMPRNLTERWKLLRVKDRWLLIVGDVPQMNLWPEEAELFLMRRRYNPNRSINCSV